MGNPGPAAFHHVVSEAQARVLLDPRSRELFQPFLGRERTVAEAAAEAGCRPATMLYRVGTFLRCGLLKLVEERPRAGRALKVYRSSHDAYFIPYALTPYADLEEAFRASFRATADRLAALGARRFRHVGWDGFRVYRRKDGQVWSEGAPDLRRPVWPDVVERPLGMDFSAEIHLSEEEAMELQRRLLSASEKGRPGEGRRPYLLSVAFAPLEGED